MKPLPLISIIVPVYNVAAYLPRCIDSLLHQTYTNIEIVLVDDGSVDASGEICDGYATQYKNITVLHQKNSGVSSARNHGLKVATGDFIGFVDPDDYVEHDMYACLYESLIAAGADISVCYWDDYYLDRCVSYSEMMYHDVVSKEDAIYREISARMCSTCNKLYSRYILRNISFNEYFINGEDRLFFIQAYRNANRIKYVGRELYHYCHRDNSAGTKKFTSGDFRLIEVCNIIRDICCEIAPKAVYSADIQIDNACLFLLKMMNYDINHYSLYGQLVINEVRKRWWRAMRNHEASLKHKLKMTFMSIHPLLFYLLSKVKQVVT